MQGLLHLTESGLLSSQLIPTALASLEQRDQRMHPFVHKLFTLKNIKFGNALLMAEIQNRVQKERDRPKHLEEKYAFQFEKVKKLLGGSDENENYLPSGGEDDDSKDENYQI